MTERGGFIGKDFVINPEGVDPMKINKDLLGHQLHEASKANAGGKKSESRKSQKKGESLHEQGNSGKQKESSLPPKTAKEIIQKATEENILLKKIFDKSPTHTEKVENFIATRIESGKSIQEIGMMLKKTVEEGGELNRESVLDATKFLTVLASETNQPDLYIGVGVGSKGFRLFTEGELVDVPDVGEVVVEPVKGKLSDEEYEKESKKFAEYIEKKEKQNRHDNLVKDLKKFDEEIQRLGMVDAVESKKTLREIGKKIIEGEEETSFFKIEAGKKVRRIRPAKYNLDESRIITQKIRIQREQIEAEQQAKGEKIKTERKIEQEVKQRKNQWRTEEDVKGKSLVESKWIYQKDNQGQIIEPEREVVDPTNPNRILDKSALVDWVHRAEQLALDPNEQKLNELYIELQRIPEQSRRQVVDPQTNEVTEEYYQISREDIEPYAQKVKDAFTGMSNERPQLTPEYIEKIQTVKGRDDIFYEILSPVLINPYETSREEINLFQQQKLDTFMYALRTSVRFPDNGPVRPEDLRGELVTYYSVKKESICSFHDIDYQARNAAGDIKSFKGAVTYLHNDNYIEAINDPVAQMSTRCYEQALKIIRDNNNGYIPPEMVSYNPKTRLNQWDEMALDLLRAQIKAGNVKEIQYDNFGRPKLDKTGLRYELGSQFTEKDMEEQYLRVRASMQMGKGIGILNMRLLEIFGRSKTAGFSQAEFGKPGPVFSSKAYEGIARWFNPMADFFGKFKMGDQMHQAFFGALMGLEKNDIESLVKLNTNEWNQIARASLEGTLDKWIEKRYGKEKVTRLLDSVDLLSFSGRCGPLSGWGEVDITIGMSDKEKERLGGSMRLFKAEAWATSQVENEFVNKRLSELVPGYSSLSKEKKDEAKALHKGKIDLELLDIKKSEHKREEYDHKVEQYKKAYRTYIWTQYAERYPTAFAGGVLDNKATYKVGNEVLHKSIRSVVMESVLGEDATIQEFLADRFKQRNNGNNPEVKDLKLDMHRDVVSGKTPDLNQKKLMARVEALEQDVITVEQKALFAGENNMPREIQDVDYSCIVGDKEIIVNGASYGKIDQETRRHQAKEYVEGIRKKVLGDKTGDQWRVELGFTEKEGGVSLDVSKIDHVLDKAKERGVLLTEELAMRDDAVHLGTEDVQWSFLDMETLGERQWARRANDLENRSNTILEMVNYLHLLRAHPDKKELSKQLEKIYMSEQNHDPKEAHKFVYMWTQATGEIYRQGKLAYIPFAGKLLQRVIPLSVAQQIKGVSEADAWSTNNMHEFIHDVGNATGMPAKEINLQGEKTPYNLERLEKNLGATKFTAALEMIALGYSIAAVAIMLSAATKSVDDEKKH